MFEARVYGTDVVLNSGPYPRFVAVLRAGCVEEPGNSVIYIVPEYETAELLFVVPLNGGHMKIVDLICFQGEGGVS